MLNFGRRERVNRYVEIFFDEAEHIFVIAQIQVGVQAALNHDLRAARVDGLLNLAQNFFMRQKVRAALIRPTEERAEFAFVLADVGIVYVSVDNESHDVAENFFAYGVRRFAQFQQVTVREKFQRRVLRQSQINSPRTKNLAETFREG